MAVIALCSASGGAGVTTSAVALAFCWPRPVVLMEADPSGPNAILAGVFRGGREYETGLLDLAASSLPLPDALAAALRPVDGTRVQVLIGTQTHSQASGLRDLWAPLGEALADLETGGKDVVIDAGRLGVVGAPDPLLAFADLTLLVTRTHLPALAAARSWAETIRNTSAWRTPGLLLIGDGQPYSTREVSKSLGLPVVTSLTDEARAAAVYHRGDGPPRGFDTGPYLRSVRAATRSIARRVAASREELVREAGR